MFAGPRVEYPVDCGRITLPLELRQQQKEKWNTIWARTKTYISAFPLSRKAAQLKSLGQEVKQQREFKKAD